MKLRNKKQAIECPECGCSEIRVEYADANSLLSWVRRQADEGIPVEISWCYCLRCGLIFEPKQELCAM